VDFDASALRAAVKNTKHAARARRLLAVAAIYDGSMRTEAAKTGDVTVRIVRDWVIKFNAHAPDGLIDRKAPGQPPKLNDAHREALMKMIEGGPTPAIHGVVRWRLIDLAQWIFEEFRFSIAVRFRVTINPRSSAKAQLVVRRLTSSSRVLCGISVACCSALLIGTDAFRDATSLRGRHRRPPRRSCRA
jgi:transposase